MNDNEVMCPHCGEVSNIGGLIGPKTNDCPRCGKPVLTRSMHHNKPMAANGLISYRYRGRYGWIMIGASTDTDALCQAQLSTDDTVTPDRLERWNGQRYMGVLS